MLPAQFCSCSKNAPFLILGQGRDKINLRQCLELHIAHMSQEHIANPPKQPLYYGGHGCGVAHRATGYEPWDCRCGHRVTSSRQRPTQARQNAVMCASSCKCTSGSSQALAVYVTP